MTLSERGQNVLTAVVKEYMLRGEPVGSSSLKRLYGLKQSPATIRNVMSELEDEGLLLQPHTSAGRVPSDQGLRFYVDRLMRVRDLTTDDMQEVMSRYELNNVEVQDLLREVSRLLSDLSQQCTVIVAPRAESSTLERIEFVQIRHNRLIAVLVTRSGLVQNRMLNIDDELSRDEMTAIHNYLNELCVGKKLGDVRRLVQRELDKDQNRYDELVTMALHLGAQALAEPSDAEVLVEGHSRLLDHPRGFNPDEMKNVLRGLEEKRLVLGLLDKTIEADGVKVFIGAETREEEMRSCALVASAYGGKRPLGTLGVIGPSSMDYPRVVSLVDFSAGILTELLGDH